MNKNSTQRAAVIDMGTNTFQLGIADFKEGKFNYLFEKSLAPKIGKGGINDNIIHEEAIKRAFAALDEFVGIAYNYDIDVGNIYAIATSAVRNAQNLVAFSNSIKENLNIDISVISGQKEAELIADGVKYAIEFNSDPFLIMDIGGGSVEFIISNAKTVFWKESFEIGGQRLMDLFFDQDPIQSANVKKLKNYLEEKLIPLANAIHQYSPKTLIGSAGSFETLAAIYNAAFFDSATENQSIASDLPIESFYDSYSKFLQFNRLERLQIPGMIELRVDMIVVASIMIDYVIMSYGINEIKVSNYALKEGVLAKLARNEPLNLK